MPNHQHQPKTWKENLTELNRIYERGNFLLNYILKDNDDGKRKMITKTKPGDLNVHNYLTTHYKISDLITCVDQTIKVESPVLLVPSSSSDLFPYVYFFRCSLNNEKFTKNSSKLCTKKCCQLIMRSQSFRDNRSRKGRPTQ